MSSIFTGTIALSLKDTLETIVDDDTDGAKAKAMFTKWCDIRSMEDAYEDDLEMGGPGYASEVDEGTTIPLGTIAEGAVTRYLPRKFGLRMIVTEEALEDGKYERVINAAGRLKRSAWKTADLDCTFMLIRAENSAYIYGDGVTLASASHTLPQGGTFSNTMATPMSPSRLAVITATSAIKVLPGHDGTREGYMPVGVVCPVEQWADWEVLNKSTNAPEAGEFNAINVVKGLNLETYPLPLWSNTTTEYAFLTDAENGFNFRWRRKLRNRSWIDNDNQVMKYSVDGRWARGNSDPGRSVYYVSA